MAVLQLKTMSNPITPISIGFSALGNNSVEGTAPGHAAVDDATPREVPLVYDSITGSWCSVISKEDQENREISLANARKSIEDIEFIKKVGFTEA